MSVEQFLQELARSGLATAPEVESLRTSHAAKSRSAAELAAILVKDGRLTQYQAQTLLNGDGQKLVLSNYTVLEQIGAGGMGIVLKARHRRMRRDVALKILPASATDSETALRRFHREVEAAARLSHPNIVAAYDAGEDHGTAFYVMEYIEGRNLYAHVKRKGPLPVEVALDCVNQAASGLEYAHAHGVIHRDIKPSNLLVDRQGTLKILDMGLARIQADDVQGISELTGTGAVMGTIDYMAPEQALDSRQADERSDIYSLGATLHYLLTAQRLLPGETPGQKIQALLADSPDPTASLQTDRAGISDNVEQIFQKMIARNPDERYQTMSEVRNDLEVVRSSLISDAAAQDLSTAEKNGSSHLGKDSVMRHAAHAGEVSTTVVVATPEAESRCGDHQQRCGRGDSYRTDSNGRTSRVARSETMVAPALGYRGLSGLGDRLDRGRPGDPPQDASRRAGDRNTAGDGQ